VQCAQQHPRLRAIVDGTTLAVCLGRLAPQEAVALVRDHLSVLATASRPPG
jgi:hypothetical protein